MNIEKMMKDLQRMQSKLRDEIETLEVEGRSGGGAVIARMNGKKDLVGLALTAEAITPDDLGMMQDLIIVAINDAGRKIDEEIERKTQSLAGGLKIPAARDGTELVTQLAAPLERLIGELAKLPGVGRKTAQRFAFHVLKAPTDDVAALVSALRELRERIRPCTVCFNLAESELCPVCADPRRERTTVCVVEDAVTVLALERTNVFRGVYHVLGGALSPLKDIGPEDLKISELVERVRRDGVREVILATSPNVEGEATAVYLSRLLKPLDVATTRLAQGLPAGADLEFTDDVTIQRALENRRDY